MKDAEFICKETNTYGLISPFEKSKMCAKNNFELGDISQKMCEKKIHTAGNPPQSYGRVICYGGGNL